MEEDAIKHPQCIPWDLSSGYNAQTLSHLSKNSHEKARFDLGVELHWPQQCTLVATGPSTCAVSWGLWGDARGLVWDPLWAGLRRLGAIIFSLSQLSSVIVIVLVLLFL
ncbi:hypothetical protein N7537_005329 [Penicillium hordei]|uniref:Uncharacterized protein n=1 Tax=Penicillium hordei TaxID=40994 RepID=A0AAD6E5X6_9EURO|nr:uncharacterized protein N7537_005329 [Penicillium hordei]KAJ5602373.1 hypothetical protein N7537_005329 [Penicillium hordei]